MSAKPKQNNFQNTINSPVSVSSFHHSDLQHIKSFSPNPSGSHLGWLAQSKSSMNIKCPLQSFQATWHRDLFYTHIWTVCYLDFWQWSASSKGVTSLCWQLGEWRCWGIEASFLSAPRNDNYQPSFLLLKADQHAGWASKMCPCWIYAKSIPSAQFTHIWSTTSNQFSACKA